MSESKEIRPRFIALDPFFNYLPDHDRYLFALPKPHLRFNLIGAGDNGQEHLRLTMLEGRATIHGVYDPNPRSIVLAKETHARYAGPDKLVVYDSLEAACDDPQADGLIICTPNYTHIDVVRVAARSGKHILLEKPMTTRVSDAAEILRLSQSYPAVFQIGLQYRFKPTYAEAIHEALERRTIGRIHAIHILEHRIPFLDKVNQWNKFSKYSGGTLVEKCCHYFDLLNLFAGSRPVSVYASGSQAVNFLNFEYNGEKSDILDNACVIVNYANGVRASFNLCMFAPLFTEELILCGDEGRLKAWEREDFLSAPQPKTGMEILQGETRPARLTTPAYPAFVERSGHFGATFIEQIRFVDNIEGLSTNTARVEEGFWSVVVGAAAEESVKSGQVVVIEELLRREGVEGI